jgi:hypothetical protein
MDTVRVFRRLVTAELGLLVLYIGYSFFEPELPATIQSWLESDAAGPLSDSASVVGLALIAVFLLLYIASLVGLLALQSWARAAYLLLTLFGVVLTPFVGYNVLSPVAALLDTLAYLLNGAVAAMLLFVPAVRERFVSKPS